MKVVDLDSYRKGSDEPTLAPLNWCDVVVLNCQIGTLELTGPNIPAIRLRVESGREHDFCFSCIADLARLGDALSDMPSASPQSLQHLVDRIEQETWRFHERL